MSKKQISIKVNGELQQFTIDYLSPAALEYWRAWVSNQAFNVYATSLNVLPVDLVLGGIKQDATPKVFELETATSPSSVQLLLKLFTGLNLIPDDVGEVFTILYPFIQKIERTTTWDEVNHRRVEQGKASLGKPSQSGGKVDV